MQSAHRSGPLKQKNKPHHTLGHKSNRQIKHKLGGKIDNKLQQLSIKKNNKVVEWRHERKNRENDLKKQKRLNAFNLKRSLGQMHNAPYIVTILNFSQQSATTNELILNLLTSYDEEDAIVQQTSNGKLLSLFNHLINR